MDERERERGGWTGFSGLLPVRPDAVCSYLLCVVGEENFVEDLGAVQLDGVQLHRMWWQLPGLHPAQRSRTPLLCHFARQTVLSEDGFLYMTPSLVQTEAQRCLSTLNFTSNSRIAQPDVWLISVTSCMNQQHTRPKKKIMNMQRIDTACRLILLAFLKRVKF